MIRKLSIFVLVMAALLTMLVALPAQAQDDVFRVAAVAPSATNDLAFSQSMFDALTKIDEEMGDAFEFTFQDGTFVVDDAAVALREWASSGEYDLIIAHGSQYGAIIQELAPEFPEISFAWGTDVNTFGLDNVFAYSAASEQGGYVNGVLAANLTESKVIGVIGPIEVGDAKLYVDGFKSGVASVDPEITVNVNYIQSFSDVPLATEAAETMLANDADILTGTAQMVVGPIAVAKENELLWFGTQASQAELAEDSAAAFQVYRWDVILNEMIESIKGGTLGGEAFTIEFANGGLEMQYNEDVINEDLMKLAEETIQGIIDGDIVPLPEVEEPAATEESN